MISKISALILEILVFNPEGYVSSFTYDQHGPGMTFTARYTYHRKHLPSNTCYVNDQHSGKALYIDTIPFKHVSPCLSFLQ